MNHEDNPKLWQYCSVKKLICAGLAGRAKEENIAYLNCIGIYGVLINKLLLVGRILFWIIFLNKNNIFEVSQFWKNAY